MVRKIEIVLVQEADVVRTRGRHARVARRALAAVLLVDDPERIALGQRAERFALFRARAVVDDEHLIGGHRLVEDALDGALDEVGAVVERDDDDDGRLGGSGGIVVGGHSAWLVIHRGGSQTDSNRSRTTPRAPRPNFS